jgi:nucleotide-binding universal stress UspA family protein
MQSGSVRQPRAVGITPKLQVFHGNSPVDGILSIALSDESDLIVMGNHGRRGLSLLIMGSTTEGVLRRRLVPVLVVREVAGA